MACVEKFLLLVGLCSLDGAVELGVDLCGHSLVCLVEIFRPLVFVEVEIRKSLACILELMTDTGHCLHVGFKLHTHLAAENVDKLDGGSGRTASEPPDVGIDDVDTLDDGCQHGGKTVTGSTVSMEINRHLEGGFQLGHEAVDTRGAYKTGHILEGDHLGTESLHLFRFLNKILIGEDLLVLGSSFRIDSIADCGVGYAAELVDHADRALDVVDIVERVENTHHIKTVLDCLLIEAFEHRVGIRHISEKVAATRQS